MKKIEKIDKVNISIAQSVKDGFVSNTYGFYSVKDMTNLYNKLNELIDRVNKEKA